jgi:hypothetical protein
MTIGEETNTALEQLQCLLRREIPDGDIVAIVDRALRLLLDDVCRRKLRMVKRPSAGTKATDPASRYVPAALFRAVWTRDDGSCAFVGRSGHRCGSRVFLELHHRDPYGLGGETTLDNLSLRCRTHNVYESELVFGPYRPRNELRPPPSIRHAASDTPTSCIELVPGRVREGR